MTWLTGAAVVLAVLAGIGAAATYIALGTQRGRMQGLEHANRDLRDEIADERRRSERIEDDLATERTKSEHCQREIDRMSGELTIFRDVIAGVSGPIANLAAVMQRTNELLASQHGEAMEGLDFMYALQIDALRLLGDTRHPARIRAEMRTRERVGEISAEDQAL